MVPITICKNVHDIISHEYSWGHDDLLLAMGETKLARRLRKVIDRGGDMISAMSPTECVERGYDPLDPQWSKFYVRGDEA